MRILCISPFFPPFFDAEAFCGAKMVQALRDTGTDVAVISDGSSLRDLGDMKRDGSQIWDALKDFTEELTPPRGRHLFTSLYRSLRYRAPLFRPRWVDMVVRRARQRHGEKPFDLVYSRSLPVRAHIAGYWCSRVLDLPWVVNINDPWDDFLFPVRRGATVPWWPKQVSRYWMNKTLRNAALVTFPSRRLMEFTRRNSSVSFPAETVPHVGWKSKLVSEPECFNLLHSGSLLLDFNGRSAKGLLEGLAEFLGNRPEVRATVRLTFTGLEDAGTKQVVDTLGLQDVVRSPGRACYQQSLDEIGKASVCVLIEAKMKEGIYLPSKLTDYVAAGKPVLALSPAVGTVADLLPDNGITRVDTDDVPGIAAALAGFYDDYRRGALRARGPSPDLAELYDAHAVAERFLAALGRAGIGKASKNAEGRESW